MATFVAGVLLLGISLSTMDVPVVFRNPQLFGPLLVMVDATVLGLLVLLGLAAYFGPRARSTGVGLVLAAVLAPVWIWKPATWPFWAVMASATVLLGAASLFRHTRRRLPLA